MAKDLTNSPVDRQNILNNPYAVTEMLKFEGAERLIKEQIAAFLKWTHVPLNGIWKSMVMNSGGTVTTLYVVKG